MPKYLYQATLTPEAVKGILKEGGSSRPAEIDRMAKALGGKLEAYYFAFGEPDVYVIIDVPDNVSAAAASLAVSASGAVRIKTTVLLTPEEIDQAAKKAPGYRPPGG